MSTHVETIIVGAGQAGLTLSHHLRALGCEHLLLERARVAERWRSERWDSFKLLTPNWHTGLPGMPYGGDDPEGFMDKSQVVALFERYARVVAAPVRTGVTVLRVQSDAAGWTVVTDGGTYAATNVVIATGHHDRPHVPAHSSRALPSDVMQLHTSQYRNPAQLPAGGVLVVGAGPSGQQIAEELALDGRHVVLAAGRHRTLPRRYRGRDSHWWMHRMGAFERTVDSLPDPAAVRGAPAFVLAAGCDDMDLRRMVAHGVVPTGRLAGVSTGRAWFADDLAATATAADGNAGAFRARVDAFIERTGMAADPPEDPPPPLGAWASAPPRELHLRRAGIRAVIWATGYRRTFSWIDAPVLDATGEPVQRRGVTAADGLFFLGLRWLHRRASDTIHGVGRDAAHLAGAIVRRQAPVPVAHDQLALGVACP